MHKRNVLDDNEWVGWLQWMRQLEPDKWFNPDFQNFINIEVLAEK
jgi:hypothetical protein